MFTLSKSLELLARLKAERSSASGGPAAEADEVGGERL